MKKILLFTMLVVLLTSCATQNQFVKDLDNKISLSKEIIKQNENEIERLENNIEIEKSKIVTYKKQKKSIK